MKEAGELRENLAQFYGTEQWFRHFLGKMLYTEGVQFFAENAGNGAYWFLDIVATEILPLNVEEEFIHIKLEVATADCRISGVAAYIKADDGNDNVLFTRPLEYTDCPEGEWSFYLESGVLLLPSEH